MIKRIQELSIGTQRLLFISSFIVALIIQYVAEPHDFFDLDDEDFWVPLIFGWIGYWVFIRIVIWIKDGYNQDS